MSINTLLDNPASQRKPWCNLYVDSLTTYQGLKVGDDLNVDGDIYCENLHAENYNFPIEEYDVETEVIFAGTVMDTISVKYIRIGRVVTVFIPEFNFESPAGNNSVISLVGIDMPSDLLRNEQKTFPCLVRSGVSNTNRGFVFLHTGSGGRMSFNSSSNTFPADSTVGWRAINFTYLSYLTVTTFADNLDAGDDFTIEEKFDEENNRLANVDGRIYYLSENTPCQNQFLTKLGYSSTNGLGNYYDGSTIGKQISGSFLNANYQRVNNRISIDFSNVKTMDFTSPGFIAYPLESLEVDLLPIVNTSALIVTYVGGVQKLGKLKMMVINDEPYMVLYPNVLDNNEQFPIGNTNGIYERTTVEFPGVDNL